jgi:hypothetical protein
LYTVPGVRNNEGLTKTYDRFHDPEERSPDILPLRELHDAMDRSVLDSYGWHDLAPRCEFLLDCDDEEAQDDAGAAPAHVGAGGRSRGGTGGRMRCGTRCWRGCWS